MRSGLHIHGSSSAAHIIKWQATDLDFRAGQVGCFLETSMWSPVNIMLSQ